jgi:hypothetical protein
MVKEYERRKVRFQRGFGGRRSGMGMGLRKSKNDFHSPTLWVKNTIRTEANLITDSVFNIHTFFKNLANHSKIDMKNSFSFLRTRCLIVLIGFFALTVSDASAVYAQTLVNTPWTTSFPATGTSYPVTIGRNLNGGPLDLLHLYGGLTAAAPWCTTVAPQKEYCDPGLAPSE